MTAPETIFYDGGCGLCHRFVRFVIKRDPDGTLFRYAPLEGAQSVTRLNYKYKELQRCGRLGLLFALKARIRLLTYLICTIWFCED